MNKNPKSKIMQIVSMAQMNGEFMQTLLKKTGKQFITQFVGWCNVLIFGMRTLKIGIKLLETKYQIMVNTLGNKLYETGHFGSLPEIRLLSALHLPPPRFLDL